MKERPILFSTPMVLAILDGSKTQTRRIVSGFALELLQQDGFTPEYVAMPENRNCRYGYAGDRLYVRETWQHSNYPLGPLDKDCVIFYRADYFDDPHGMDGEKSPEGKYRDWKPSIHMPRWASRTLLEITGVRIERLQDISEADCIAEGSAGGHGSIPGYNYSATPSEHYQHIWETINGPGSWDANPWVWVVEFKVVKP